MCRPICPLQHVATQATNLVRFLNACIGLLNAETQVSLTDAVTMRDAVVQTLDSTYVTTESGSATTFVNQTLLLINTRNIQLPLRVPQV
jgi:hypothetical protein